MSSSSDDGAVDVNVSTIGVDKALDRVAETTQLDERNAGITIGRGIEPPYPPSRLAALQEMNGTHAVAVAKKASREVGFGFDVVAHERADSPERDEDAEWGDIDSFWNGRESIWKVGPKGTPVATPDEVFEQARQDFHGIGWLAIELIYTADDRLAGLAHLPAKTVRVRSDGDGSRTAGHGYVQKRDGDTVYFAEAGDRHREDVNGNDDSLYVNRENGEVTDDRPSNPSNEILFIPNPHPNALYYGIPTWVSEIQTMVGDHEARRFNREFFEWDAMGQYFVVVEGGTLTESSRDDVRNLVKSLREEEGRRVAVLEADELESNDITLDGDDGGNARIRIEQLQNHGDEDMAFISYRERNEHDIAKVHEVPPQLVNNMGDSNRSNIKESIRDFTKEVIEPAQERFAGRLYSIIHQMIFDVDDWTLEFRTKGAENEREKAEVAATVIESIGRAMTVREARLEHGLKGKPEWMSDEFANTYLHELGGNESPGESLERALADVEESAVSKSRTQERINRQSASAD